MIDPLEFRTLCERLGLTHNWFYARLGIAERTVRDWKTGGAAVPDGIMENIREIEYITDLHVGMMINALQFGDDELIVYHSDEAFHEASAQSKDIMFWELPAAWWRHVAVRAVQEVPGARVVSYSGDDPESRYRFEVD